MFLISAAAFPQTAIEQEAMRHFRALVQIDSTDPPGNETRVIDYVKKVLESEGISSSIFSKDPARANLVARIKGNGSKKPLLIMGHSDTVVVDPTKWTFPPFSATLDGGYVYGRGTRDDKSDLVAALMTVLRLKRDKAPLDRDVIFVSEAGEEAAPAFGIEYLVNEHWADIEAEICLAEGGGVTRKGGKAIFATVATTEKRPQAVTMVASGPAGHGSRPLQGNAVVHLARAVEKIASWEPPTEFNDTTRTYFEMAANFGSPEDAARYKALFDPEKSPAARAWLAANEPATYSLLHTSISPNMIRAGQLINVIPSTAEATLDVRMMPGTNVENLLNMMRGVINDPAVRLVPDDRNQRPAAPPSRIDTDVYKSIEAAFKTVYAVSTTPVMLTGATDMAFLRAKGVQAYGIGAMADDEDTLKGFGPHSDQERILVEAIYKHVAFFHEAVTAIAGSKK